MKVRDIMTTEVRTARLDSTLEEVAALMKEENVGAIPVLDEDDELAGIVTDRDIVVRCVAEGKDATECTAEEVMSSEPQTVKPGDEVEEASRLMADQQIRRLPVVEKDSLVGIISLGDIAVKESEEVAGETLEEVSKGVKENVGRPRRQVGGKASPRRIEAESDLEENEEVEMTGAGKARGRQEAMEQPSVRGRGRSSPPPNEGRKESIQGISSRSRAIEDKGRQKVTPIRAGGTKAVSKRGAQRRKAG